MEEIQNGIKHWKHRCWVRNSNYLRTSELVKAIEEKFDVSAAAPVAVAGPAAGGAAEEQTEFTVELTAAGDQKLKLSKQFVKQLA